MADTANHHPNEEQNSNNNNATAASTPGSDGGGQGGTKVPKDRNCPFCGQAFTSSSLGRHLDLYIKPKNPKPPDGVHDLAEIRKLRGGITRRQPRSSLRGAGTSDDGEATAAGTPKSASLQSGKKTWESRWAEYGGNVGPGGGASPEPLNTREQTAPRIHNVNAPNWQATGVINNLPPRAPSRSNANTPTSLHHGGQVQRIQDMRRDGAGNRTQRPGEFERDDAWKVQESVETGRAAELALREVLGSLEAARSRTQPKVLFESFDFFSMSFGALCLAILPQPGTLFSATPFPSPDSCTLQPPGKMQLDVLTRLVWERVIQRRNGNVENRHLFSDSDVFKHQTHVSGAWEHWASMSDHARQEAWTVECLRAFELTKQCLSRTKSQLSEAEQRVAHLEKEYDRLSRCQLPRELLMGIPYTTPISDPIVRELNKQRKTSAQNPNANPNSTTDTTSFDADTLLTKWRHIVRASARPQPYNNTSNANPTGIATDSRSRAWNSPIPRATHTPHTRNPNDEVASSMIMSGSVFGVNGAMPRSGDDAVNPTHNQTSYQQQQQQNYGRGSAYGRPEIVDYQTPTNPGAVVGPAGDGDEGEEDELAGNGEEADAEGEEEEDGEGSGDFGGYLGSGGGHGGRGVLNGNGKRGFVGSGGGDVGSARRGAKALRESPTISRDPDEGGVLALGGIPDITHSPTFISILIRPVGINGSDGTLVYEFYTINIDGFAYSRSAHEQFASSTAPPNSRKCPVTAPNTACIVDSGTTLLYAPDVVAAAVVGLFSPPGYFDTELQVHFVDCAAVPPTFGIMIDDKVFYVNALDMRLQIAPGQCISGVQPSFGGYVILGDVFMKNVLAVFDLGSQNLRFAARTKYALSSGSVAPVGR